MLGALPGSHVRPPLPPMRLVPAELPTRAVASPSHLRPSRLSLYSHIETASLPQLVSASLHRVAQKSVACAAGVVVDTLKLEHDEHRRVMVIKYRLQSPDASLDITRYPPATQQPNLKPHRSDG